MSVTLYSSYWRSFGAVIFTSSQNWTVPPGVFKIKVIAVGGGGGGGGGYSSTYTGGGGGSGGVAYVEALVQPGWTLGVTVGAGGSAGTGGSSPTAGGNGGNSSVDGPYGGMVLAGGGGGGGAATSSANGSNGGGGAGWAWQSINVISAFGLPGASGNGTASANPTILPLGAVASISGIQTSFYGAVGVGGAGGAVNSNGSPGGNGAVLIWWGD